MGEKGALWGEGIDEIWRYTRDKKQGVRNRE